MNGIKGLLCGAAVFLMACGQVSTQPLTGETGKADSVGKQKVKWSDGEFTRGEYIGTWSEWYTPRIIDGIKKYSGMPNASFELLKSQPELLYSVEAYAWDDLGKGNLNFVVPTDTLPKRLGGNAFWIKVRLSADLPERDYDLALLKFYNEDGVDDYSKIVVPLKEAVAGRMISPADEAKSGSADKGKSAPGLFNLLQSAGDSPDRVGMAGTWKVIVVPHQTDPAVDTVLGDSSVQVNRLWMVAPMAPMPAPAEPTAAFLETHNEVAQALEARDYDKLNQYLDPECGIFKLVSPGAMTWMVNSEGFNPDFVAQNFFVNSSYTNPALWYMPPTYVCHADEWNMPGKVMANVQNYQRLTDIQEYMIEEAGMPSGPEYDAMLQKCQGVISMSVTSTDDSVTLNYGLVDGQWRLIVMDMSTACDA